MIIQNHALQRAAERQISLARMLRASKHGQKGPGNMPNRSKMELDGIRIIMDGSLLISAMWLDSLKEKEQWPGGKDGPKPGAKIGPNGSKLIQSALDSGKKVIQLKDALILKADELDGPR